MAVQAEVPYFDGTQSRSQEEDEGGRWRLGAVEKDGSLQSNYND